MQAFGYKKRECRNNLMELEEVTIVANSEILRRLATFILKCADEIEDAPQSWSHEHFQGADSEFAPEFIICNPEEGHSDVQ